MFPFGAREPAEGAQGCGCSRGRREWRESPGALGGRSSGSQGRRRCESRYCGACTVVQGNHHAVTSQTQLQALPGLLGLRQTKHTSRGSGVSPCEATARAVDQSLRDRSMSRWGRAGATSASSCPALSHPRRDTTKWAEVSTDCPILRDILQSWREGTGTCVSPEVSGVGGGVEVSGPAPGSALRTVTSAFSAGGTVSGTLMWLPLGVAGDRVLGEMSQGWQKAKSMRNSLSVLPELAN